MPDNEFRNATFAELGLAVPILKALSEEGHQTPTPIQLAAIPPAMTGRDVMGLARTGTGKTAAFALPILHRLASDRTPAPPRGARVLILAPTRELAAQIAERLSAYGRHMRVSVALVFGGVGQGPQVECMRRGVDVLIAAPGRLLDLMGQGHIDLSRVGTLVLDEADRMLDMGFQRDIAKITAVLPANRTTMMFSATMAPAVAAIAAKLLRDPVRVETAPQSTTVEKVKQSIMFVDSSDKASVLLKLLKAPSATRTIVFTLTKHGANKVAENLEKAGISAQAIHGNKSQGQRERALAGFKSGAVKVLVATDVASRGIDVDDISHVINFDVPNLPESYVHRIGRTARAGKGGWAVTLCDQEQRAWLRAVERATGEVIPVFADHPHHSEAAMKSTMQPPVLGGNRNAGPRGATSGRRFPSGKPSSGHTSNGNGGHRSRYAASGRV